MKTKIQYFNLFTSGFCTAMTLACFLTGNPWGGVVVLSLAVFNFVMFLDDNVDFVD